MWATMRVDSPPKWLAAKRARFLSGSPGPASIQVSPDLGKHGLLMLNLLDVAISSVSQGFEHADGAYSIQAGNCYLDKFGVIFEVKTIEKGQVSFISYGKTTGAGKATSQTALPMAKFIENLQEQVVCPSGQSWE